tara:strand:+ start:1119 stop:1463 length:345 start_codon:yes stop_codon:yes gene_type:complete
MPEAVGGLADYGSLGLMVLFLIWQHLGMQRRLDALTESFQATLKDIDDGYERRVEVMRGRYDVVIEGIRKECREAEDKVTAQRDAIQSELATIVRDADRKLDTVIERIGKLAGD